MVPFADRFEMTALGRLQSVKGTVKLIVLEFGVSGVTVVENLKFHARISRVAGTRIMNAKPIVASWRQQKVEFEDIIRVLLFRNEVTPLANEHTVLDDVFGLLPTRKILTIKKGNGFLALGKAYGDKKERNEGFGFHDGVHFFLGGVFFSAG